MAKNGLKRCPICRQIYEGGYCLRCAKVAWQHIMEPEEKFCRKHAKAIWEFLAEPIIECRALAAIERVKVVNA
jgi:hypothetical protein